MKLLKLSRPKDGTWRAAFCRWFVDNVNWCEGYYYTSGVPKPDNKLYNFFYKYWLFPFEQNDCLCCNTVRGVIYGIVIGVLLCL